MKRIKLIKIIIFVCVVLITLSNNITLAVEISNPDAPSLPTTTNVINFEIDYATGRIWSTFAIIAQTIAIAAIVLTGVRYMFTNYSDRADIKLQTIILIFGSVLVFAAVPFAKFIVYIINDIF